MQCNQCFLCANYSGDRTCLAFLEGIPEKILTGEHDHREAYPGDHGTRFLSLPEAIRPKGGSNQ